MNPNPYEPDSQLEYAKHEPEKTSLRWLRLAVYLHLLAIIGCAVLTLYDRGRLKLHGIPQALIEICSIPLSGSLMICPILTMVAASKLKDRSFTFRVSMVIVAILMMLFQVWVCLPMVQ